MAIMKSNAHEQIDQEPKEIGEQILGQGDDRS